MARKTYNILALRKSGEYAVLRRVRSKEQAEKQVADLKAKDIEAKVEEHKPSKK